MRSLVHIEKKQLDIVSADVDKLSIEDDEVLLKVKYSAVCGSDISTISRKPQGKSRVLGHEFSGVAVDKGKNVENIIIGKLYNVQPNIHCGTCKPCHKKSFSLCVEKTNYGGKLPGGFSDFCVVKEKCLQEIDGVREDMSCLLEPVSCCLKAINKCNLNGDENILILGSGFTGIIMTKMLVNNGHKVTVFDRKHVFLRMAKLIGAESAHAAFDSIQGSFDLVIDTTASVDLLELSIDLLDNSGKLLLFGVCSEDSEIRVNPYHIWKKEIQIITTRSSNHDHSLALQFLKKNDLSFTVTHRLSLEDLTDFENVFDSSYVKGIICL